MILVYGGMYNGKIQYVKETYHINDDDIYDFSVVKYRDIATIKDILDRYKCVYNISHIIKDMLSTQVDTKELKDIFYGYRDKDIIVVSDDISCGVVPIEKSDRIYREEVSRFNTYISSISSEVYRVFLGIPTKIK